MSFLYPTFLWALAALSIPVIIHLFNFRRTTRVFFSSTRFLKEVKEVTTAKRRLKHLLILASRLLFIFFLVMTFAQPIIPAREQLSGHRNIILYLDNSLSMSAQFEDKSRALDAATAFAHDIVALFPSDTRYKLITNDFSPFSNTYKTKAEVADLLTQLRLSPVSRSAGEIITRLQQDARRHDNVEVFWISDFQKSTFGLVDQEVDSSLRFHLVPLSPEASDNIFVDSAYLENPFAIGQEKNSLRVIMRNGGSKDAGQLNLRLTINNIQAATASVSVPAGGTRETSFDLTTGLSGFNKAHIRFNDSPISFDNDFYLALNFTEKINIVEIKASPQSTPVERVFGNRQIFSYRGFAVGNFNYSLLYQADLVVVNGIDMIDPSLALALREYLGNFGTVLFIPGSKPEINSYRSFLNLPVSLASDPVQNLDHPDFSNPFFENVFEERTTSIAMPSIRRLLDWGMDRSAILKFRSGQPFLSVYQQGGKLYVMSSPLADEFSDLSHHALFVPVMYRVASNAKRHESRRYYTLQEDFVSLKLDSLVGEEPLRLVGENEVVPSQRKLGDRVLLDLPKYSLSQGFYHVVLNRDTVDLLAFNLDKDESIMERYTVDEVKSILGTGPDITVFEANSMKAFSNEIKDRYLGKPLWKYALVLALFFLLVEILLIRFMK